MPIRAIARLIQTMLYARRFFPYYVYNILGGIESVYRWEGRIARDSEVLMIIKTTDERYAELEEQIKALHSYTTPEVIAIRIERGSEAYLKWLSGSVAPQAND